MDGQTDGCNTNAIPKVGRIISLVLVFIRQYKTNRCAVQTQQRTNDERFADTNSTVSTSRTNVLRGRRKR